MVVNWVRLELDLTGFEAPPIDPEVQRSDVRLTTLAELGDNGDTRYRLFQLNRECSADIPGRGPFHTWEEYRRLRLEVPWFDPHGVSLAVDGDGWVGMAAFTVHPQRDDGGGYLFSEMTGVVRRWHRRGLATALKAHNLDLAQRSGLPTIRTVHHPGNTAMISLNRGLGFVDASWEYPA
jgi:RimJ/RimL family protein N-acetyltransferase